jgi:O-antigen/teichoic acid export membrane protein
MSLTAALNLVLAIVLTPRFGPVGTAWATLTAAIARALALRIYIRRAMGLRIPAFRP